MKFSPVLLSMLGAAVAVAASTGAGGLKHPRGFRPRGKIGTRDDKPHGGLLRALDGPKKGDNITASTYTSANWSGGVLTNLNGGTGYRFAQGTFTVPVPHPPPGQDPSAFYGAAVWVGIDGVRCSEGGLIQAGVAVTVDGGVPTYQAWYEWVTDEPLEPIDLPVTAGDQIRVSIYANTTTSGTTVIENLTQKVSYTQNFSNMQAELCFETAEWIVEDFSINGGQAPFANYTTATFTNCTTNLGGLSNADTWNMDPNNVILSTCKTNNAANSVTCTYTG